MKASIIFETIMGYITIIENDGYITDIIFGEVKTKNGDVTPLLYRVKEQILEYLAGKRKTFDFPIKFTGSSFTKTVWREIAFVPYGKTITYSELALLIGKPQAQRAVGTACGKNKITLIIPCHRIVSKKNGIGGFGADITIKKALLELEKKYSNT